jgi:DNA mismatch endonuclease (patch repair protein)
MPKSRLEFWENKLEGNRRRDIKKIEELESMGWRVLIIWECELKNLTALATRLQNFLDGGMSP